MNPYFESSKFWHEFHQGLTLYLRNAISAKLSDNYFVKLEEQLYVHEIIEESSAFLGRADVAVIRASATQESPTSADVAVIDPPPMHLKLVPPVTDIERESYIEIRDRDSQQLVTVIELLSPANKNPGKDRDQYLRKRAQLLKSSVHLVEIDLLRRGPRMPVEGLPQCDYCLLVSRAERRPIAEVWPFKVTEPFPPVLVPLKNDDAPLKLNLAEIFQRLFVDANYAKIIYQSPPDPPLSPELEKWAAQLIGR